MVCGSSKQRKGLILVCVLIGTATLSGRGYAQSALLRHPVFAKYPSAEDLQDRVDAFIREHADEFEAARRDFDLALRSTLDLHWPQLIRRGQPIMIRKWPLRVLSLRSTYEYQLTDVRERAGSFSPQEVHKQARAQEWIAFYREHRDELAVEPSSALRHVTLNVLLNGWDDWSGWTTDRLRGYRERYPDIYRIVAVNLRGQMNHELWQRKRRGEPTAALEKDDGLRADGVILRMLLEPDASAHLRQHVRSQVMRIHADLDALDFAVKLALDAESPEPLRNNGRYCMGSLTESLPLDQQRDYWVQHLDSDDYSIRSAAVSRVGINIDLLKKDAKEQATNAQLAQRLRRIAAFDPDPRIRLEASRRVTAYEDDSPPRGLVDYSKGKN